MDALNFLLSNGRSTEIPELNNSIEVLVRTAVCASPSSTENSQNNAWNVNFSDGNTNNNNKYNSNAVRAVAALGEDIKEGWVAAFHDCCRNKKSSHNCNEYRAADWELDLWLLVYEIYFLHNYTPKTSVCFIVTRPTLREIFAANFRDRIVQHWICMRLEPLFDKHFKSQGDVSHNCRKRYGTRSAVDALERDIKELSQNYTREAWVAKIDIQSFFMSIDTRILWQNLERFIKEEYKGDDIDILLYLTEVTVKHRPQNDCVRQSPGELWEMLAPHKSLFNRPEGIGIAIGNITSQQEANFYMSFYVEEIKPIAEEAGAKIEQFVDDVPCVAPTKEFCLKFRKESERILREKLNLDAPQQILPPAGQERRQVRRAGHNARKTLHQQPHAVQFREPAEQNRAPLPANPRRQDNRRYPNQTPTRHLQHQQLPRLYGAHRQLPNARQDFPKRVPRILEDLLHPAICGLQSKSEIRHQTIFNQPRDTELWYGFTLRPSQGRSKPRRTSA